MITDFLNILEDTFGKYRHGMRSAIEDKLTNITDNDFQELIKYLTEDYDLARPPSLKVIMGECYKHNIPLHLQNMLYGI